MAFGCGQDAALIFGDEGAAHWASADVPVVRVCNLEVGSLVARDEQGFVAIGHLVGRSIKSQDVALRVGEGAHTATAAGSGFGNGRRFALEGFAFIGGASDEDGAASFAVGVSGLRRVPGDVHVTLRIGGDGTAAIEVMMLRSGSKAVQASLNLV